MSASNAVKTSFIRSMNPSCEQQGAGLHSNCGAVMASAYSRKVGHVNLGIDWTSHGPRHRNGLQRGSYSSPCQRGIAHATIGNVPPCSISRYFARAAGHALQGSDRPRGRRTSATSISPGLHWNPRHTKSAGVATGRYTRQLACIDLKVSHFSFQSRIPDNIVSCG